MKPIEIIIMCLIGSVYLTLFILMIIEGQETEIKTPKEIKMNKKETIENLTRKIDDLEYKVFCVNCDIHKLQQRVEILEFLRDNPSGFKKVEVFELLKTKLEYIYKNGIRFKELPFNDWNLTEDGKIKANGKLYTFDKETEILTEVGNARQEELEHTVTITGNQMITDEKKYPIQWNIIDEYKPKKKKAKKNEIKKNKSVCNKSSNKRKSVAKR